MVQDADFALVCKSRDVRVHGGVEVHEMTLGSRRVLDVELGELANAGTEDAGLDFFVADLRDGFEHRFYRTAHVALHDEVDDLGTAGRLFVRDRSGTFIVLVGGMNRSLLLHTLLLLRFADQVDCFHILGHLITLDLLQPIVDDRFSLCFVECLKHFVACHRLLAPAIYLDWQPRAGFLDFKAGLVAKTTDPRPGVPGDDKVAGPHRAPSN
jgi:hypothetical protein